MLYYTTGGWWVVYYTIPLVDDGDGGWMMVGGILYHWWMVDGILYTIGIGGGGEPPGSRSPPSFFLSLCRSNRLVSSISQLAVEQLEAIIQVVSCFATARSLKFNIV